MADITTYDGLQSSVADWIVKRSLTDQIKTFIRLAESRFLREVKALAETYSVVNAGNLFTVNANPMILPAEIQSVRAIYGNSDGTFPEIPIVGTEEWRASIGRQSGVSSNLPIVAHVIDNPADDQLRLVFSPFATSIDIDIEYNKTLDYLSATNQQNALIKKYPDLYLYGTLVEAAPYLKDDSRVTLWEGRYEDIVRSINNLADDRRLGAGKRRGYFVAR